MITTLAFDVTSPLLKNTVKFVCVEFITCDEKLSVGFYYDYIKMHPGRKHFWEDDLVDSTKATELIIKPIIYKRPFVFFFLKLELIIDDAKKY